MNEQITSAAELDALPVGSVVARLHNDGHGNSVYTLTDEGWRAATEPMRPGVGPVFNQDDERMADLIVLYRPDQPQRVQPSQEDVARLLAHQNTDWIHGYLGADPATGETHDHGPRCSNWEPYAEDADAVLALFAQQPTVAEVKAEALREYAGALGLALAGADPDDFTGYEWVLTLLRNRADGIEAGR